MSLSCDPFELEPLWAENGLSCGWSRSRMCFFSALTGYASGAMLDQDCKRNVLLQHQRKSGTRKTWRAEGFCHQPDLLAEGAATDVRDWNCWTPLLLAAQRGFDGAVAMLLESKANIEARDRSGCTPLILAAQGGHERVVRLLPKARANVEATDLRSSSIGWTPLGWACKTGHEAVAKQLLNFGAAIEAIGFRDSRPLSVAA
ncbi:ankyrin repeat-containing protein [Rutstroemia sp. NJR-2017a WRK4]|nr:ankyrin repeat-containing protein [Rutstroemia sp. NJR-2017a WRK4]